MHEEQLIANLSRRLGRVRPQEAPPVRVTRGAPEFWLEFSLDCAAAVERFQSELAKVGGAAQVYTNLTLLHEGLSQLLQQLDPRGIGVWGGAELAEFELGGVLLPYRQVPWGVDPGSKEQEGMRAAQISAGADVDVGITGCVYAVADTGTIVLATNPHRGRSVSLLPAVHIALIRSSQVRTRLGQVLQELGEQAGEAVGLPSSINFITGPSRSADIENDLSLGVHGPAAVYAFILRDST